MTTPLEACGKPYFFKVTHGDNISLQVPAPKREVSARLWVRSLSEMQKEALIRVSDRDGTGNAGEAEPVETHVYLRSSEDDDFARTILDMAEKTRFLHAFCRTDLKTRYRITRS